MRFARVMHGAYDPLIVALSVLTAMLAVYVALDLTGRVAVTDGISRMAWVIAGALATGVGMWTMHFTGMLALHLPIAVHYALGGITLALAIAVGASVIALTAAAHYGALSLPIVGGGIILGVGMTAMHVVAMASMRMAAQPILEGRLIALSIATAIVAGVALVSLAARLREDETWRGWRRRIAAACLVGALIAIMHYTAMAGTTFTPASRAFVMTDWQVVPTHGVAFTAVGSCIVMLVLALSGSAVDRSLRSRLGKTAEHARLRSEAEAARDAAEAANRAKSEFLAAMSHELRTPLNAISGYTELLQMGVHGTLNEKQLEDLARIQRAQKHLLSLINDVLNFAKIEAGKLQLHPHAVDVRMMLTAVEAMITPQLEARGLSFECRSDTPRLEVFCDPEKTEQVLLNLLSNAVKFTMSGGSIELISARDGEMVTFSVRDTGVGIPGDKLEAIFEPFVQVERNLTRTAEGAGLGLAISRDLARAMGGDLTVRSRLREGSTFTLTLPAAAMPAVRPRRAETAVIR